MAELVCPIKEAILCSKYLYFTCKCPDGSSYLYAARRGAACDETFKLKVGREISLKVGKDGCRCDLKEKRVSGRERKENKTN